MAISVSRYHEEAGTLELFFFMFHSWIITNYTRVLKGPFILWLHLSATTLIILLCNLSHLWCSGGKTFSLDNWDHYDCAFCGAFTCFAVEQAGFKTSEFFPDVLLNNWTYPWGLFRNSTSDCVYSPRSSMHSFLWSLWKGLCSCETIAQWCWAEEEGWPFIQAADLWL